MEIPAACAAQTFRCKAWSLRKWFLRYYRGDFRDKAVVRVFKTSKIGWNSSSRKKASERSRASWKSET